MEELIELRVRAEHASRVFEPDEGALLGSGHTRRIIIRGDDPRLPDIIGTQAELQALQPSALLATYAAITRKYTPAEWTAAELFTARINAVFHPTGEECGTIYDESRTCPVCGAGRIRVGPLRLDARSIPKSAEVAQTIAGDELVVSERLADAIKGEGLTGVELTPVEPALGARNQKAASWFAIRVTSPPLQFSPRARFGNSIIEPQNPYACPTGDTAGHALLSEAILAQRPTELSDFYTSSQYLESRRATFVPYRLLFLSPRVERVLRALKPRKLYLEVARFE